ncbi:hypothetical protein B9Z55_015513 [Caenorhabditis nigoni]|uniref:Uncharacterized protein n=1 Tax=Caenorhabditis nigoni TaxID=1611254 RepID=A0A2G5UAK7_9PELO|nr:hypothetical protein B9Z55_015513 [Caenorhabditis nigoni]
MLGPPENSNPNDSDNYEDLEEPVSKDVFASNSSQESCCETCQEESKEAPEDTAPEEAPEDVVLDCQESESQNPTELEKLEGRIQEVEDDLELKESEPKEQKEEEDSWEGEESKDQKKTSSELLPKREDLYKFVIQKVEAELIEIRDEKIPLRHASNFLKKSILD